MRTHAAKADYDRLVELTDGHPGESANGKHADEVIALKQRIVARRRKAVLLVEELNLQGKKVRPIIDLVESRLSELRRLNRKLLARTLKASANVCWHAATMSATRTLA